MVLNSSLLTLNRQRAPENFMKNYKPVQNSKKKGREKELLWICWVILLLEVHGWGQVVFKDGL